MKYQQIIKEQFKELFEKLTLTLRELRTFSMELSVDNTHSRMSSFRCLIPKLDVLKFYLDLGMNINDIAYCLSNNLPISCRKCKECGNIFYSTVNGCKVKPICRNCTPQYTSAGEREILSFIRRFDKNVISRDHTILNGRRELDIYSEKFKLAVEFNGDYWHSVENGTQKKYSHLEKTKECENLGITLVHVWEDEWIKDKKSILKQIKRVIKHLNPTYDLSKLELTLDRSAGIDYKYLQENGFEKIEEVGPELITRDKFGVYNCGYVKFRKVELS